MSKKQNLTDKQKFVRNMRTGGLGFAVIGLVLAIIPATQTVGGILVLVGVLGFCFAGSIAKDGFCSQCGTKRGWNEAESVEWEVVEVVEKDYEEVAKVEVQFTCPKCGTVDVRKTSVVTTQVNKNTGIVTHKNIEQELKKKYK